MSASRFWIGRRVFLTGHTGFKGAWACALLSRLGAKVTGYSLDPPTEPSLFDLARIGALVEDRRGDIRDGTALERAMIAADADVVIHMAAQSLVRASYVDPVATWAANVMGTVHVLEASRRCAPQAVLIVTSDKCYDQRGQAQPFREDDPLGGHDPYSSSKAAAEIAAASWRDSFLGQGAAVVTARAGNVVGGGDFARDRIVPDAVRAWRSGEVLDVRAPQAVRPWQHVLEPLSGYLALVERACAEPSGLQGAWNFGPGAAHERTVAELLAEVAKNLGDAFAWLPDARPHPAEAPVLRLDASKSIRQLGWRCRLDFAETIAWTMSFYRRNAAGAKAQALMSDQIEDYLARSNPDGEPCASS